MTTFTLDTSGTVHFGTPYAKAHGLLTFYRWPDLDPFTQGYVEAALLSVAHAWVDMNGRHQARFTDLAPETLAMILRDCAAYLKTKVWVSEPKSEGRWFWVERAKGDFPAFPPLTAYLGDDGKVRLRAS